MYECNHCNYKSARMWCINRHALNKHGKNNNGVESNRAPVTMSIGKNVESAPTTVFGEGNQSNGAPTTQYGIQPTSHYESTSAEIYPLNTVTMEEHNNVVEIANGWKTACENLQHSWKNECEKLNNQIKSGVFTHEDIDKELINAVTPWEIAHKKDAEEKHKLWEELENLPIYMNKNIIPRINILNDNMGEYPDRVIHCICEALYNIRWKYNKLMCESTKCEFKRQLESIKKYIRLLSRKKLSIKKKRAILSKPQVGKGVFTALYI